nr:Trp biosynthesis-associated membrane protein [Microbacterium bovistercoris]
MTARARLLAVVVIVLCGALGVISSTQTWLTVALSGGAGADLTVSGAAAVPVLAPLSLAVLALGIALSIAGVVLRYIFGALAAVIAVAQGWLAAQVVFTHPVSAVARTVTDATGITGEQPVSALVASITASPWPAITLVVWILLAVAGVFVLVTARRWPVSGRKYRTDAAKAHDAGPLDAVDSWDELSRGEDPTGGADPR